MNLIIDGNNLAHRCYWISEKQQEKLSSPDGYPSGCVYVFLNSIKSFIKNFGTTNIYVCWDKKLTYPSTNFREIVTEGTYKAQRTQEGRDLLYYQIDVIEKILPTLGIKNMYPDIMEGDDVIAYLADNLPGPNIIISVDQDLMQLVSDKTAFYNLNKKIIIDQHNFEKETTIKHDIFVLYKAIMGDTSDNIKGLAGYGKIKAKKLAESWDSNKANLTAEQLKIVEVNLSLMDLRWAYQNYAKEKNSYENQLSGHEKIQLDLNAFKELCEKYNFQSYLEYFNEWEDLFKTKRNLSDLFGK